MNSAFINPSAILRLVRRGLAFGSFAAILIGCNSGEIKPVDIFPEDMCAYCRMAISDESFAAEIITADREVFKFDDIGCMEKFAQKTDDLKILARYVKDFETKVWLNYDTSTIVQTSIKTPMGSGKIAFPDSGRAKAFTAAHQPTTKKTRSCCESGHGTR
jgi:copper chaperone NosL